MMMNWRIMRLIVQMFLQVESRTRSSAQSNPPTTSPSFLQHLDLQVSSYLSGWSLSRLNERRSQLAESKWDSFNSESFKSLSVVVTQKTPKTHWTKETTTGALVWVHVLVKMMQMCSGKHLWSRKEYRCSDSKWLILTIQYLNSCILVEESPSVNVFFVWKCTHISSSPEGAVEHSP